MIQYNGLKKKADKLLARGSLTTMQRLERECALLGNDLITLAEAVRTIEESGIPVGEVKVRQTWKGYRENRRAKKLARRSGTPRSEAASMDGVPARSGTGIDEV